MLLVVTSLLLTVSSQFIAYPTAFDGSTYVVPTGTAVSHYGISASETPFSTSYATHHSKIEYSESEAVDSSSFSELTPQTILTFTTSSAPFSPDTSKSEISYTSSSTSSSILRTKDTLEPNNAEYYTSTTVVHTFYKTVPCTTSSTTSSVKPFIMTGSHATTGVASPILESNSILSSVSSVSYSSIHFPSPSPPPSISTSTSTSTSASTSSTSRWVSNTPSTPTFKSSVIFNSTKCVPSTVISTVTVTGRIVTKTEVALTTITSIVA